MIKQDRNFHLPWQSVGLWVGLTLVGYILGSDLHYQANGPLIPFNAQDLDLKAALVGFIFGAVSGLIVGSLQWLVLKTWKPRTRFWIPFNSIAFGLVHALNDAIPYLPFPLLLILGVGGGIVGLAQASAFRPSLSRLMGWALLAAGTWLISFQLKFGIVDFVLGNPLAELVLGGGAAGLITGIITGAALLFIIPDHPIALRNHSDTQPDSIKITGA